MKNQNFLRASHQKKKGKWWEFPAILSRDPPQPPKSFFFFLLIFSIHYIFLVLLKLFLITTFLFCSDNIFNVCFFFIEREKLSYFSVINIKLLIYYFIIFWSFIFLVGNPIGNWVDKTTTWKPGSFWKVMGIPGNTVPGSFPPSPPQTKQRKKNTES